MKNISIIIILAILILGGYFLFSQSPMSEENLSGEPFLDLSDISTEDVNYFEDVEGFLARPAGEGNYPGIILIHEWWGLNDDIKSLAQRFASEGYVALAVDLYDGEFTTDSAKARELSGAVRENTEEAFANLESALDYLKVQGYVDSEKLASVGWCFGGGWAYQMAVNNLGTDASVMYYGQFDPEMDFEMMRSSILGHFGEEDSAIAIDNVREFQTALETSEGMHEVYIYPNVGHGFANVRGGDNLEYSEEAAELAWERTQNFLSQVFSAQ